MSRRPISTVERFRRAQRDWEVYRRRSLYRRTWPRFQRDLMIVPHAFLARETLRWGRLAAGREQTLAALRGRVVWTLDTAARLACGRGIVRGTDLTGYLSAATLDEVERAGLVGPTRRERLPFEPLVERPALLIAHVTDEPPPHLTLATGERVVTWEHWQCDLMGTLGWRPDLLTRLEDIYPRA